MDIKIISVETVKPDNFRKPVISVETSYPAFPGWTAKVTRTGLLRLLRTYFPGDASWMQRVILEECLEQGNAVERSTYHGSTFVFRKVAK